MTVFQDFFTLYPENKKYNILIYLLTKNTIYAIILSNRPFAAKSEFSVIFCLERTRKSTFGKDVINLKLSGLQKLTLLDFPGTMACTVFTCGCNFRCPFCHNAPLVLPDSSGETLEESELIDFLKKRSGIIDGVVFTGGEPLLHSDILDLFKRIKELGYKIKLDTNGSFPATLEKAVNERLVDRVAMDIKSSPSEYFKAIGTDRVDFSKIEYSKSFLMTNGINYEFRTTVVKGIHTMENLIEAAKWIEGAKEYYLQQFKDSGNLLAGKGLSEFSKAEMEKLADAIRPYVPAVALRGV